MYTFTDAPNIEVGNATWRCEVRNDGVRIAAKLDATKLSHVFRVEVEADGSAMAVIGPGKTIRTVPRPVLDWLLGGTR
jgi:hypothetical protein